MLRRVLVFGLIVGAGLMVELPEAQAQREHIVRRGHTLGRVARRYGVRVRDLAAANGLSVTAELRLGQTLRIPERGVHYVARGETLGRIARRRGVRVQDLARANNIRVDAQVREGQRLLLPGQDSLQERERAADRWGAPRNRGVVTFFRVATRERVRIRVLDSRGRPRRAARRRLAHLFRHHQTGREGELHPRLLQVLVRVSDHFGGRTINVLSGYRPSSASNGGESRHVTGRAADIRVQGVNNRILRDYLRSLDQLGVGYYPNSTFVHVDVRERKAYWVDRSGPGEDADYVRDRAAREDVDPGELDEGPDDDDGADDNDDEDEG